MFPISFVLVSFIERGIVISMFLSSGIGGIELYNCVFFIMAAFAGRKPCVIISRYL